jgi:transaldolase
MSINQLLQIRSRFGQSPWLEGLLPNEQLKNLVGPNALGGITASYAYFRDGIAGGARYTEILAPYHPKEGFPELFAAYDAIAFHDVGVSAQHFRHLYEPTHGAEGYVSIGIPPPSAHHADDMVSQAHRIYNAIGQPNVMIQIPATSQGIAAVRTLIAEGISVEVTLIFDHSTHRQVIDAYIGGLEDRATKGESLANVASIVSVPIAPIDTYVDARLDQIIRTEKLASTSMRCRAFNQVKGLVAIANARLLYQEFMGSFSGSAWARLAEKGAHPQRLNWVSTKPEIPGFAATHYCDRLAGRDTVLSMSPETLHSFRRHESTFQELTQNVSEAQIVIDSLEQIARISMEEVSAHLLTQGLRSVDETFDQLIHALASTLMRSTASAT